MLDRLVASARPRGLFRGTPGALLSAAVHGLVIAGAVAATRPAADPAPTRSSDSLYWMVLPTASPPTGAEQAGPGSPLPGIPITDGLPNDLRRIPATFSPDGIPDPDGGLAVGLGARGPSPTLGWPFGGGSGPHGVVTAAVADEPPVLLTHPELDYPASLRAAGIEGTVLIEVIVDATGVPEAGSFRVVSSSHPGFEAPARSVVLSARFRPGRWGGRPVRVLIRQPVEFRLR